MIFATMSSALVITESQYMSAFENWADNYEIEFSSNEEKLNKYQNFKSNIQQIGSVNGAVNEYGVRAVYDTNVWASHTPADLAVMLGGAVPPADLTNPVAAPGLSPTPLPLYQIAIIAVAGGAAIIGTAIALAVRAKRNKKKNQQQNKLEKTQTESPSPPPSSPQQPPTLTLQLQQPEEGKNTTPKMVKENLRVMQQNSPGKMLEIIARTDSNSKTAENVRQQGGVDVLSLTPKSRIASITARKIILDKELGEFKLDDGEIDR
jgi:hypothetical protein